MSCRCKNECSNCGCERNRKPCTPCYKKQLADANKAILAAADILLDYIEEYELDDEDCLEDDYDDDYGYDCECGCNSKPSCDCKPPCGITHECCHKIPCNQGNHGHSGNQGHSGCGKKPRGCWGRA